MAGGKYPGPGPLPAFAGGSGDSVAVYWGAINLVNNQYVLLVHGTMSHRSEYTMIQYK